MTMKKIALLTDSYWPFRGGVEESVRQLAAHLSSHYDLTVFTHSRSGMAPTLFGHYSKTHNQEVYQDPSGKRVILISPSKFGKIILCGLLIWNIPLIKRKNASRLYDRLYFFYKSSYWNFFCKHLSHYDLVHNFSGSYPGRCATEVCRILEIPVIHSPYIHFGRWGDSPSQMKAYNSGSALISHSRHYKKQFIDHSEEVAPLLPVIPPFIPEPQETEIDPKPVEGRFFLFLGRREAHKGLHELIELSNELRLEISLVVAGEGKEVLTGKGHRVTDLGMVDERLKRWLFSHCDFFCMPSRDETFGIVYAEAMSYGKPVLALDIAPVNELIRDGENGILVAPGDLRALKQGIEMLAGDSDARMVMGRKGRELFLRRYSCKGRVRKIEALYRWSLRHVEPDREE